MTIMNPIEDIIADIRMGKMAILVDDEERENEGDLILAAHFVSPEHINFMAKHGRGLICLTLTDARSKQLNLPCMVPNNQTRFGTNFTVSIEAARGVSSGISATDRAHTIQTAVAQQASPIDIISPGHVFPLVAQVGGVLVRAGHTEAGCDLAQLAGLEPASVICEVLNDDGSMARLPDLVQFAQKHNLKIGTIADLIRYRTQHECLVECVAQREIVTPFGAMNLRAYHDKLTQETHLALVKGTPTPDKETVVRVHEPLSCLDLLDMSHRTHSWNALSALSYVAKAECGVMVLLNLQETSEHLIRYMQQADETAHTVTELRHYGIGSQILRDCGVGKMILLAMPRKMPSMEGFGLTVTRYVECRP